MMLKKDYTISRFRNEKREETKSRNKDTLDGLGGNKMVIYSYIHVKIKKELDHK